MNIRWTHITITASDVDGTIRFFTEVCGLSVVRDRRKEGGNTIWLGPKPPPGADPDFVVVIEKGKVEAPLDHFGFQCETRQQVTDIAAAAKSRGALVDGPKDLGGTIGYFALVREPSGHLVEFTHGQPLKGLTST